VWSGPENRLQRLTASYMVITRRARQALEPSGSKDTSKHSPAFCQASSPLSVPLSGSPTRLIAHSSTLVEPKANLTAHALLVISHNSVLCRSFSSVAAPNGWK